MASFLNRTENEGLIVVGRVVDNGWKEHEKIEAVAAAVDAWAAKLSLPLGLVYCGTTINWPNEDPSYSPILIGLVTFDGPGDDDEPIAGTVEPSQMALAQAEKIPAAFWSALEAEHGVTFSGEPNVYLAAAGWTWTRLESPDGEKVSTSTEDDGYCEVPEALRMQPLTMKTGYC